MSYIVRNGMTFVKNCLEDPGVERTEVLTLYILIFITFH